MRLLITGHDGYLGRVLVPFLLRHGHEVVGLDSFLFSGCRFGDDSGRPSIPELRLDIRDASARELDGFDAVLHLAAISNDPLGDLNPECTDEINHRAAVRLGRLAREAGVARFLQSSSCSLYGAAGDRLLDESAGFRPVTPYGVSKVQAEQGLAELADKSFCPVFLRHATVYGASPRLRADLVVNNLVGYALTTGQVLIKSDGTPWRPLVHVEDVARAFLAALRAPAADVRGEAFNVGRTAENYQVRDLAEMVRAAVPGSAVEYAEDAGPDPRCYRVDCAKIAARLPEFDPQWDVEKGIDQLVTAYRDAGLTEAEFLGSKFLRIRRVRCLIEEGRLDASLRWLRQAPGAGPAVLRG